MKDQRRTFFKQSLIGSFGLLPISYGFKLIQDPSLTEIGKDYPSYSLEDMRAVVGASHTKLDVVKKLVEERPELAKATYDWGFGDVESALGAAAHMGRKDIAEFLIEHGARPDIYTYAMLGKLGAVKAMIEDMPGIQKILGPHGFTLLHHAKMRIKRKNVEGEELIAQQALVSYLEGIEGADERSTSISTTAEEKAIYLGRYDFGESESEYFEFSVNRMDMLSMSRAGMSGRNLNKVAEHTFAPSGAPSIRIVFEFTDGVVQSFVIHDGAPVLKAVKVS